MNRSIVAGVSSLLLVLLLGSCAYVQAQWQIPPIAGVVTNSATSLGSDCFTLTTGANTMGVVWNTAQMDLSQPFDITLFTNQQPWGADGLALVLQSAGLGAYGSGANGLGYGASLPPTPGYNPIVPSLAFELDTWDNTGAGLLDIPQDHVAIHRNGDLTTAVAGPVSALASGTDVTDLLCHTLRVTWDPNTTRFKVFFDNNPLPRINIVYNAVVLVFGGNPLVWWGVTAGSGGAGMTQTVCIGTNFADAGPDRAVCEGDTLQLHGTGGVGYAWLPGPPTLTNGGTANPVFGPVASGTYTVSTQATNATGCTDRDTTIITVSPTPLANPGPGGTVCLGDSLLLGIAAVPNTNYLWSPGAGLSSINNSKPWCRPGSAGIFNYTLITTSTLGLGCADTAMVSVSVLDTPNVMLSAVPDSLCSGSPTTLNAMGINGSPPYGYGWSNLASGPSQVVMPLTSTMFSVTVTDNANCRSVGHIPVTVHPLPVVQLSANPGPICAGDSSVMLAAGSIGTPPFAYLWNDGTVTAADSVLPGATTAYSCSITDVYGCQNAASYTLVVNPGVTLDILHPDTVICLGGSVAIQNTLQTGGITTWMWSPATGVSNPSSPTTTISPSSSTTYYLLGTNGSTGCASTDSIRLDYIPLGPPIPQLDTVKTICAGVSLLLDAGNPGFHFIWNTGATTQQISTGAAGPYDVLIYDTLGCSYQLKDSILVNVIQPPQPQLGADTTICAGGSILLQVAVAGTVHWSNGIVGPSVTVFPPATVDVSMRDSFGCVGADTIVLLTYPIPNVGFAALAPGYCLTDSPTVLVGSPTGGMFTGAADSLGVFSPALAGGGNHGVFYTFTDVHGCSAADSQFTLVGLPPSPAVAGANQQVTTQAVLDATIPAVGAGHWDVGNFPGTFSSTTDAHAVATSNTGGQYAVIWIVDNPPCPSNSDTLVLTFGGLVIPTGFSPNGDGFNDQFEIKGLSAYPGTKVQIFNRWGNEVWASNDYHNDWVGQNAQSQPLVEDTYFAVVESGGMSWASYVVLKR